MMPGMETARNLRFASSAGLWLAPLLHVTSFWLMLEEVEPFHTGFYSLAWWSYIVFVSAINQRWRGNSLLFDRGREFLWMFLASTPAWLFFELWNFRLHNWHYLGVPTEWWVRLPGYFLAFGTVLPGIFETRTLLQNLGLRFRSRKDGAATSSSRRGRLVHCPESPRRYCGRLFADSFVVLRRNTPGIAASRASLTTKIHPELTTRTSRTVH